MNLEKRLSDQVIVLIAKILKLKINAVPEDAEDRFMQVNAFVKTILQGLLGAIQGS